MKQIDDYELILTEIARREGIICLQQYDDCKIDGKNALEFLSLADKTRDRLRKNGSVDWNWITHDLINEASSDIAYSLKNVFLYRPGINNFNEEIIKISPNETHTYNQTLEDKRYLYYSGITFEKLYSFWDRIGDLLNLVFNLNFHPKKVFFAKVIDRLVARGIQSQHLDWLKTFKDGDYNNFVSKRHEIVHARGLHSYFYKSWLEGVSHNKAKEFWNGLQEEKEGLPVFLKKQSELTIQGFEQTVRFIQEQEH